jgi:dTDP-4-dehydrorhamnose reductase
LQTALVQISTDYVFDGEYGNYRESDPPNPRGNYARSKLAAENIIRAGNVEHLIARTQVLFGTGQRVRPNFATWVIEQLRQGKKINVVTDQIGCPTYAPDLAEGIYRLLQNQAYGIFHISGADCLSRFDFAVKIARIFNLDEELIIPITTEVLRQKAPRPMNSTSREREAHAQASWAPAAFAWATTC